MSYRIKGLSLEPFVGLFGMDDAELAARGAIRLTAQSKPGAPCRDHTWRMQKPGESADPAQSCQS